MFFVFVFFFFLVFGVVSGVRRLARWPSHALSLSFSLSFSLRPQSHLLDVTIGGVDALDLLGTVRSAELAARRWCETHRDSFLSDGSGEKEEEKSEVQGT